LLVLMKYRSIGSDTINHANPTFLLPILRAPPVKFSFSY
jgi:hypothetical protein